MVDSYVIVLSKRADGWLAQLCYCKEIVAEATEDTQLAAMTQARRNAEPWFTNAETGRV